MAENERLEKRAEKAFEEWGQNQQGYNDEDLMRGMSVAISFGAKFASIIRKEAMEEACRWLCDWCRSSAISECHIEPAEKRDGKWLHHEIGYSRECTFDCAAAAIREQMEKDGYWHGKISSRYCPERDDRHLPEPKAQPISCSHAGSCHGLPCEEKSARTLAAMNMPEAQPASQEPPCTCKDPDFGHAICPKHGPSTVKPEAASPGTELCLKCHRPKEPSRPNSRYCRKCDGRCVSCGYDPCECPGTDMPPKAARQHVEDWFKLPYHDLGFRHEGLCVEAGSTLIDPQCVYCRVITAMAAYRMNTKDEMAALKSAAAPTLQGVPLTQADQKSFGSVEELWAAYLEQQGQIVDLKIALQGVEGPTDAERKAILDDLARTEVAQGTYYLIPEPLQPKGVEAAAREIAKAVILNHNRIEVDSEDFLAEEFSDILSRHLQVGDGPDWKEKYESHLKHVQAFLKEMWATMGDPVEDFTGNVEQLCAELLTIARDQREYIHSLPANWHQDSSLETWFPLTAEELKRVKKERDEWKETAPRTQPLPSGIEPRCPKCGCRNIRLEYSNGQVTWIKCLGDDQGNFCDANAAASTEYAQFFSHKPEQEKP